MDTQVKFCDCPCHAEGSTIMHFVNCCDICVKCGAGILSGYKVHFESCEGTLLQKKKRKWKAGFNVEKPPGDKQGKENNV